MSLLKQNTLETGKAASENVVLKCGDCLHFTGSPHPSIGQACSLIGVKKFATAPNCYTANVHVFRKVSPQTLTLLSSIISSFSPSQSKVLMGLLKQQASLQTRYNISFLERVFFKIGDDYLDNYFAGFALGLGPQKEILIVGSDFMKNSQTSVVASLMRESVLTLSEFKKERQQLIDSGRLYAPRGKGKVDIPEVLDDYEPPTIETSVDLLEKRAQPKVKRSSVLQIRDNT